MIDLEKQTSARVRRMAKKMRKKDKKASVQRKTTWNKVTAADQKYLKEDAKRNRVSVTTWRERQVHLVDIAKDMLADKLDKSGVESRGSRSYRISNQMLANYYNSRFTERQLSVDALQRVMDMYRKSQGSVRAENWERDGAHSLHFDEACNLAEIAGIAFLPVTEVEEQCAMNENDLKKMLSIILEDVKAIVDDTTEVVDKHGNDIERSQMLTVLLRYVTAFARKLLSADDFTDEDLEKSYYTFRKADKSLTGIEDNFQFMGEGPQRTLYMSLISFTQAMVMLLIEKIELEEITRGIHANSNLPEQVEAFSRIKKRLRKFCSMDYDQNDSE